MTKYYLILQRLPGDYTIINIADLDIYNRGYDEGSLDSIDKFTKNYSVDEIKSSIARCNLAKEEYLNGPLRIVSTSRNNFSVLTRDKWDIISSGIDNISVIGPIFKQKIKSYFNNQVSGLKNNETILYDSLITLFNKAVNENNSQEMYRIIDSLPPLNRRNVYLSIYRDRMNYKKKPKDFQRERVRELDNAA